MGQYSDIDELKSIASQVRRDIVRMVHGAQSGHPGGSLGCTDLLVALYFSIMDHDPSFNPDGKNEDMFFLSNGHISPVLYSVLARSGYFDVKDLATFRKLGTRLQGHPATEEKLPGIRIASGSLGQGLSVAIGAALSKKMSGDEKTIFALMGDGELQEGQVWEAAMFAASNKVDNLIAAVDFNGQQIDGPTSEVNDMGDLKAKWEAFGWKVIEANGNDMADIVSNIKLAKSLSKKESPVLILMKTEMGAGVDFMEGTHKWHGIPPKDDDLENALGQLEETLGDY
jgi:transketolase